MSNAEVIGSLREGALLSTEFIYTEEGADSGTDSGVDSGINVSVVRGSSGGVVSFFLNHSDIGGMVGNFIFLAHSGILVPGIDILGNGTYRLIKINTATIRAMTKAIYPNIPIMLNRMKTPTITASDIETVYISSIVCIKVFS